MFLLLFLHGHKHFHIDIQLEYIFEWFLVAQVKYVAVVEWGMELHSVAHNV